MKQFLRYQITGSSFFLWMLIFLVVSDISFTEQLKTQPNLLKSFTTAEFLLVEKGEEAKILSINTKENNSTIVLRSFNNAMDVKISRDKIIVLNKIESSFLGTILTFMVAFSMPIGVMIHQLSVMIKNILARCGLSELSDKPIRIDQTNEILYKVNEHVLQKISDLNTYYYIRIDNAVLAPLLAYCLSDYFYTVSLASICWFMIGYIIIMVIYIPVIYLDMKRYNNDDYTTKYEWKEICCIVVVIVIPALMCFVCK